MIDSVKALDKRDFSPEELKAIDGYAVDAGINLWARSAELRIIASDPAPRRAGRPLR